MWHLCMKQGMWSKAITSVLFTPYPQGFPFIYLLWQSKEIFCSLWHLHVSKDIITQSLNLTYRWIMTMAYTVESFKSKDDNLFSFQSGSFLCNTLHIKMTEKTKKKTKKTPQLWLRTQWALPMTSLQLPQKNWKDSPVPGEISFLLYSLPKLPFLFSKCLVLTYYI